jgi:hypothetical protein
MDTLLITIAQTALLVGTPLGPLVSPALPANSLSYTVSVTGVVWPVSGDVLKVIIERSDDNGTTWRFDASHQGSWRDKLGAVPTNAFWRVVLPQDGIATRKLRVTLEVFQACTLAASVSSQ